MCEINKKILELIEQNRSIKEISSILGISEKQFFVRLKQIINYGYQIVPSYSYNSDIYYKLQRDSYIPEKNTIRIKIPNSKKEFRCMSISDFHIGNVHSDSDLFKRGYEYAAKNGINVIFICGDIFEGTHTSDSKKLKDIYSQIETFIKKYPYDENIINIAIFGNHDYHSLHYDGLDIMKTIGNARYDIIPIGYGKGIVKLKEDKLLLSHKLSVVADQDIGDDCKLSLVGHGHMMKTKLYDKLYICLPPFSYVSPDKTKEVIPGFIDMTIHFEKGLFEFIEAKHMIITPKIYQASETRCRIKELFKNSNQQRNGR